MKMKIVTRMKKVQKKQLQKGWKMVNADTDEDEEGGEAEKSLRAIMDIDNGVFHNLSAFFCIFDSINTNVSYHYRSSNVCYPCSTIYHPSNQLLSSLPHFSHLSATQQ
jgi:hypothetical protein